MFALYQIVSDAPLTYLHVSVQNLPVVEGLEPAHNLNEDVPNFLLFDVGLALLVRADLLEHVAVVRVLHDQAVGVRGDGNLP